MEADNHECQGTEKHHMCYHLAPHEVFLQRGMIQIMRPDDLDILSNHQARGICHRVPWRSIQHCMQPKFQPLLKKP